MSYEIEVLNQQQLIPIDSAALQRLVEQTLQLNNIPQAEINLLLVDNTTIHGLNMAHLQHDFATDVITFPMNDVGCEPPEFPLEGEIVISVEMAMEMARSIGWNAEYELQLYLIHGLLHLCGYDDLDPASQLQMRRRELEMLQALQIPPEPADPRWEGLSMQPLTPGET